MVIGHIAPLNTGEGVIQLLGHRADLEVVDDIILLLRCQLGAV